MDTAPPGYEARRRKAYFAAGAMLAGTYIFASVLASAAVVSLLAAVLHWDAEKVLWAAYSCALGLTAAGAAVAGYRADFSDEMSIQVDRF
jgi:hypothetical protein